MTKISNCRPPEMRIALPTEAYDKKSRGGPARGAGRGARRKGPSVVDRPWGTGYAPPAYRPN